MDGQKTLKLVARDERRRVRAEEKKRDSESRRVRSAQRIRAREKAYKDRHDSTITPNKRRRGVTAVFWTDKGISKLQKYSVREMIFRHMRENYKAGEAIDIKKLQKACEGFLYGDDVRPHLYKLEEAAHIEYVFDKDS